MVQVYLETEDFSTGNSIFVIRFSLKLLRSSLTLKTLENTPINNHNRIGFNCPLDYYSPRENFRKFQKVPSAMAY
jgi:hypothetical protein